MSIEDWKSSIPMQIIRKITFKTKLATYICSNQNSMKLKIFFRILGIVAVILTIFPYISWDSWIIRIFDFPHLQLTLLTLFALLFYFIKFDLKNRLDYLFIGVLAACFLFQTTKIFPYTAFSKLEIQDGSLDANGKISIYTANVLQTNNNHEALIRDIEDFNAEVILLTETNRSWMSHISKEFRKKYPYKVEVPQENTYGMMLYSKLELFDESVRYLVEDTIPSIHAKLILEGKDTIQLLAIHPAPPTPQHNPSSVDRDAEMMKIAKISRNSKLPVIVMGDFNDVAWSQTTKLFQRVSGLLDLRKGRGFFSTYNAKNWIMRWPLDHIFTSSEFRVLQVELGAFINSDHFPFYTVLSFEPHIAKFQELPGATKEELEKAFKEIKDEVEADVEDN